MRLVATGLGAVLLACVVGGGVSSAEPGGAAPVWVLPPLADASIERGLLTSAAVGGPVSYEVARPPAGSASEPGCYPVLYWLHGTGGGAEGVTKIAAAVRAAVVTGQAPPMIVVFPNGLPAHLWTDAWDGRASVETMVVDELVDHVDANYPTFPTREARWIGGFSMGGYGAARLALRHPDRFSSSLVLAPGPLSPAFDGERATHNPALRDQILRDVYGGDLAAFAAQSPLRLVETLPPDGVRAVSWWLAVGQRDFTAAETRSLALGLGRAGATVAFREVPDLGHQPAQLLDALGDGLWAWYREQAAGLPTGCASASR
jgi:S-formylglutathione hydrolase FrmB